MFALESYVNLAEPRIDTRNEVDRELNDTKARAVDDQETIDGIVKRYEESGSVPDQKTMAFACQSSYRTVEISLARKRNSLCAYVCRDFFFFFFYQ